ncbi:DUF4270 family protein [Olivibacter sitiensis]|uniref:DUF4270 family protein n=1 Tax=Olivibacter sitiensis TaxID=376470 RepID=UPI000422510F|nr:DUF4270 family protein [Olivibacter sitiensis]
MSVNKTYRILIFLLISSVFMACEKEGIVSLSNSIDGIGAEISDTSTVLVSTHQFSELPSSNKEVILVGAVNDELGTVTASSYFRIGNSAISSIAGSLPSDAQFDSLSLELPYNTYYYGDTTQYQTIALHRITEDMALVEVSSALESDEIPVFVSGSALYTNSTFEYDPIPLGSTRFRPKPSASTGTSTDTLMIKVNGEFGLDLWNKILAYDVRTTDSEQFLDYLKGFVLFPSSDAQSITGFYTDSLTLRLHYSYYGSDGMKTHSFISMKIDDRTYQFNHIEHNRQNSEISTLEANVEGSISSTETDNKAYIQGLTGLVTKIQFPYMDEMMNRNDLILNKAELIIESPNKNQDIYPSPSSLVLLVSNDYGVPSSLLPVSYETSTQTIGIQKATIGSTATNKYTFDLTEYISNYRSATNNAKKILYLSLPTSDLTATVNRLVVASGQGKPLITLRMIYTKH